MYIQGLVGLVWSGFSISLYIFIIISYRMWFFCCLSFSFILCGVFSLDIFDADFWSSYQSVLREVASLMEKLKFTALASRASWTSISYTRVFNRWRSFTAEVLDIFSPRIWSSGSSDDSQVNQLNQKLKLTMLASRASGTSEHYLRAFNRWAEFAKGVLGVPGFPVGPMDCALHLQFLLQSSNSASAIKCAFQPLILGKKPSRWHISRNLLKGLTSAIFCN